MDSARFLSRSYLAALALLSLLLRGDGCGDGLERVPCSEDSECDDGVFCNGRELCDPEDPRASFKGCISSIPCEPTVTDGVLRQAVCDEEAKECLMPKCRTDAECNDGRFCNGIESCNPSHPTADFRGCRRGPEPCDEDQSCQEVSRTCRTDCGTVADGDGDGHASIACGGADCDDDDADRFPGNPEVCDEDGHDEDCNPRTFGDRDADNDGYVSNACFSRPESGPPLRGRDCDDSDPAVHRGANEVCNGVDEDCDGLTDEGLLLMLHPDRDYDGYGAADSDPINVCPGTPGYAELATDCDDTNPLIVPGAFRCNSAQGNTFEQCDDTGNWLKGTCPNAAPCVQQPSGIGVCLL